MVYDDEPITMRLLEGQVRTTTHAEHSVRVTQLE